MNKKYQSVDHKMFVVTGEFLDIVNRGGSIALTLGYTDHEGLVGNTKGAYVEYVISKDGKTGRERAKRFRFDSSLRRLLTRDTDRDINGILQYKYLKNHPSCEGSPYGTYKTNGEQGGIMFREMNSAADAKVALDADQLRIGAQASALSLDNQTLEEVANIIGHYGAVDHIMKLRVVEFAGKRPVEYNELLESGDRNLRAIVRKALAEGVFTKKGELVMWESTIVGNNEDAAIAKIAGDSEMLSALKEKMNLKIDVKKKKKVKA
jgi:hypothetical protein